MSAEEYSALDLQSRSRIMARPLRVEYPGAYYHVMNRGNGGQDIFGGRRDNQRFIEYVEKCVQRYSILVHTYCLMNNHYHLLIETVEPNLSVAIQWLNVSYAAYYNRKHQKNGHLFQGRFKALLINADEYLVPLSRYIHLNPVRAKMVAKPAEYPWSSYAAFIGKENVPDFLETHRVLSYFGRKRREAIQSYKAFVEAVDVTGLENPETNVVAGFVMGDDDFVNWVRDRFLSTMDDEKEIPQLKKLKPRVSLETVLQAVCREFGCSEEQVREKGRKGNKARELAIYLARDLTGVAGKDLGVFFGGVSGAAITVKYNQVMDAMARSRRLRDMLETITKRIMNNK